MIKSLKTLFGIAAMVLVCSLSAQAQNRVSDAANNANNKVQNTSNQVTTSTDNAKQSVDDTKNKKVFYYYPNSSIYFHVKNEEYTYQLGGKWTTTKDVPVALRAAVAGSAYRVMIYPSTDTPWKENDKYQKEYPAQK